MKGEKCGIALMNLGSPASAGEVRVFLRRLFEDIEMVRFPGERQLRPYLAALIAALRAERVRRRYRLLGGTSPLLPITKTQAAGLEAALLRRGFDVPVEMCMRYSRPFASEAVEKLAARGVRQIVGLPLYPQYSDSTSGSSLRALARAVAERGPGISLRAIEHWCDDPEYHSVLATRIRRCRQRVRGSTGVGILFLAHSLPVRFVERGDPYVKQVELTVAGVLDALEKQPGEHLPWMLAYQSQVGPVKWVGPTVQQALEATLGKGIRRVIVVPVSFVSDHLETLYEIDLHYRRMAFELGCEQFERIESLNGSDDFISVLAERVVRELRKESSSGPPHQRTGTEGMS